MATKWKVKVSFVGEEPEDGQRILRDIKTLVSHDRDHGRISSYSYYGEPTDEEDVYDFMVETKQKVKKNKRTMTVPVCRQFRVRIELENRTWKIILTQSGLPVYVAVDE